MKLASLEDLITSGRPGVEREVVRLGCAGNLAEVKVYALKNAVVLTSGAIVLPDSPSKCIVKESMIRPLTAESVIKSFYGEKDGMLRIQENVLSLADVRSHAPYHWIMDQIPKYLSANKLNFSGKIIIRNIEYEKESLHLLGVEPDSVLICQNAYSCETLFVPEKPSWKRELDFSPVISEIRAAYGDMFKATDHKKKVFVDRKNVASRRIVNHDDLMAVLSRHGVDVVLMENLSFAEKIGLASSAGLLMGPLGSGMAHCIFMNRDSIMAELFSPNYIMNYHYQVVRYLGLNYYMFPSEILHNQTYQYGLDIHAPVENIDHFLSRLDERGIAKTG